MDIEKDFVHLARLAVDGKRDDVSALLRRSLSKIASTRKDLKPAVTKVLARLERPQVTREVVMAPLPVDLDSRLELVTRIEPGQQFVAPVWTPELASLFSSVLAERGKKDLLLEHELTFTRSMLLVGPPGVGKTLAATWLANELQLPLLVLDLSAVMSSFLGRTGNNVRTVLDFARQGEHVLLLDEFDAIAKRRDDGSEVGELKRLVTVLLQSIDNWPSHGLLLAATNHPELLDPAVWRRFERVIHFPLPSADEIGEIVERLAPTLSGVEVDILRRLLGGRSYADIERLINNGKRQSLVELSSLGDLFSNCLTQLVNGASNERRQEIALLLVKTGWSQRAASLHTGVSRDTIRKRVKVDNHG